MVKYGLPPLVFVAAHMCHAPVGVADSYNTAAKHMLNGAFCGVGTQGCLTTVFNTNNATLMPTHCVVNPSGHCPNTKLA